MGAAPAGAFWNPEGGTWRVADCGGHRVASAAGVGRAHGPRQCGFNPLRLPDPEVYASRIVLTVQASGGDGAAPCSTVIIDAQVATSGTGEPSEDACRLID